MIAANYTTEAYFAAFAQQIIGNYQWFDSPYGRKKMLYADWTASGRAYQPLEDAIQEHILPFYGNTHTETTVTGMGMTKAYEQAKTIIKQHVNAGANDSLIFCASGATHAVNKLQRILGLRIPERVQDYHHHAYPYTQADEQLQPVVFVTHMEHHSNHTSWLETIAKVVIIDAGETGYPDLVHLGQLLEEHKARKYKIAAVTACSNVTGMHTPYHAIAKMLHAYGGWCFVDFAAAAPYTAIDMHPREKGAYLDAIYFSGHKFLGGPGAAGVLIFNHRLYNNQVPDQPGGGTVFYSNPWNRHCFTDDIEQREDGGTPPIIAAIRIAMCIRLKESMGIERIAAREKELTDIVYHRMQNISNCTLLEARNKNRLSIFSFIIHNAHHHLFVKILNDRFGVQSRGGCSCAGTYGHYLLNVNKEQSRKILQSLRKGNMAAKPGWVRISLHPVMSNAMVQQVMDAVEATAVNYATWAADYWYDNAAQQYRHITEQAGGGFALHQVFSVF